MKNLSSNFPIFLGWKLATNSILSLPYKLTLLGSIEKLGIFGKDKVTFLEGITFLTLKLISVCWWLGQSPNLNRFFSNLI